MSETTLCECQKWATQDLKKMMLGNGHHPVCNLFQPNIKAVELLTKLVEEMRYLYLDKDSMPPSCWEVYKEAVFVTSGEILND